MKNKIVNTIQASKKKKKKNHCLCVFGFILCGYSLSIAIFFFWFVRRFFFYKIKWMTLVKMKNAFFLFRANQKKEFSFSCFIFHSSSFLFACTHYRLTQICDPEWSQRKEDYTNIHRAREREKSNKTSDRRLVV